MTDQRPPQASKDDDTRQLAFTGEYYVPGQTDKRIAQDHLARYRFAASFVANRRVLDIACGTGYAAPLLLTAGAASYIGVDRNNRLIEHATTTYGRCGAMFTRGDICTIALADPVDIILCFETIEHVDDYMSALSNLYSALRPGGHLLISSPNRLITSPSAKSLDDRPINRYHTREFVPIELMLALRTAGFAVRRSDIFGQRPRLHTRLTTFNRIANKIAYNNSSAASSLVRRCRFLTPRYFLLISRRPPVST
jgi:SAM-dependent methyltransferase